jgi:serine/threonine protein kinase
MYMRAQYGTEIDLWSVGCIFGELLNGSAILPGRDEADQLDLIFTLCGTPTQESWPAVSELPDWPAWKLKAETEPRQRSLHTKFRQ